MTIKELKEKAVRFEMSNELADNLLDYCGENALTVNIIKNALITLTYCNETTERSNIKDEIYSLLDNIR